MRSFKTRGCFTLFLLLLLHNDQAAGTESQAERNETIQYRLPRVAIPISYEIKFIPEIVEGNFTFYGETQIALRVLEETSCVTLHSKDLRIDESFTSIVSAADSFALPAKNHSYDNVTNFLTIEFNQPIAIGNYTLGLKFAGNMTSVPEGIYNSSYINEKGEKVWLAATKFTQIHARRSFPCWDEPDLKATFNLSIKHYQNFTAVSNMPVRNKFLDDDGKQWTNFEITPIMSTYLLAFVVSDFDCLRDDNEKFNVCGRRDVLPFLKHSRDVSQRALALLEKYIDVKYNLPKLDQFAVPDATTGATENWGLIIYRESSFAYEPFVHPISTKEYLTLTVVHELAHQWNGNLVTPVAWKYSWIKEGLPTFLQYYIVDKLFPDWRETDMFVTRVIQEAAFNFDSTVYYEALEWHSDRPADIRSKFSPQIYNRGAAIFHMMSNIVTENVFRAGVGKFIKENEYGTFTSDDLWSAMQSAYNESNKKSESDLSIKDVMTSWVVQQGYPIVNVTRDYATGAVVITQEGNLAEQKFNRWSIPINFATKSNPNFEETRPTHWLKPEVKSLTIDGIDKDDWIIVNIQQSGYYRVDYDETNWKRIAEYMNSENYKKIHVRNRAQLINDLSFMATSNRQNYTTFLDLVSYLVREDDYQPWLPTFHAVRKLRRAMYDEEVDEELKKFILGRMDKVIKKIGFEDRSKHDWVTKYKSIYESMDSKTKKFVPTENALENISKSEDFLTRRLRAKFLSFACSLGHAACLESAKAQLRASIENGTENLISPDLVSWVNCHGAFGSEADLLKKINGSDIKYLGYLGCSPDKTVLRNYVDQAIAGNINATAKQTRIAFGYLSEDSTANLEFAVDYFINNYDAICKCFSKDMPDDKLPPNVVHQVAALLNDLIWRVRTLDQMKKIADLVDKESSNPCMPSWLKDIIAKQTMKIQWSEKNAAVLGEWLHDHSSLASSSV